MVGSSSIWKLVKTHLLSENDDVDLLGRVVTNRGLRIQLNRDLTMILVIEISVLFFQSSGEWVKTKTLTFHISDICRVSIYPDAPVGTAAAAARCS